ncbi:hypothetical protein [Nitrospira sp. Nam74]
MDILKLQVEELEERIAPAITPVTTLTNGGGNEPQGHGASNGQGIDETTTNVNPSGSAPPGQNK